MMDKPRRQETKRDGQVWRDPQPIRRHLEAREARSGRRSSGGWMTGDMVKYSYYAKSDQTILIKNPAEFSAICRAEKDE